MWVFNKAMQMGVNSASELEVMTPNGDYFMLMETHMMPYMEVNTHNYDHSSMVVSTKETQNVARLMVDRGAPYEGV